MSLPSLLAGAALGVAIALGWRSFMDTRKKERKKEREKEPESEVLFFPDSDLDPSLSEEERVLRYKSVLCGSRPLARMLEHLEGAKRQEFLFFSFLKPLLVVSQSCKFMKLLAIFEGEKHRIVNTK